MRELSGRALVGASKITERNALEFNQIVAAVDDCGGEAVRLDLTDIDISGLWRRPGEAFFKLAMRPNLTLVLDPTTAEILESYLLVAGRTALYEVREPEVAPEEEDPRIGQFGAEYAAYAVERNGKLQFKATDTGLDTFSSIGLSAVYMCRALELLAKRASESGLKCVIDFSGILLEGGCDLVFAETLAACRNAHKLNVKVIGDAGISEYVRVRGNVKLPAELKVRYFKKLTPGTVLRLNTYKSVRRADIAGRKGAGVIAGAATVVFRGLEEVDVLFDEIPAQRLYLAGDLEALGESSQDSDICVPRRRNLTELGIQGVCSGSHGHLSVLAKDEIYQVSENGKLSEMAEPEFVARGLRALGIKFNEELLAQGRMFARSKTV
ncbi:hypothetical protein FACS1894208_00040 [Clostridia bacterium]|nr:hypothetical protein FACS1894208_00040 [Clostridia bacterium]